MAVASRQRNSRGTIRQFARNCCHARVGLCTARPIHHAQLHGTARNSRAEANRPEIGGCGNFPSRQPFCLSRHCATLALTLAAGGGATVETTVLMTCEELDAAAKKPPSSGPRDSKRFTSAQTALEVGAGLRGGADFGSRTELGASRGGRWQGRCDGRSSAKALLWVLRPPPVSFAASAQRLSCASAPDARCLGCALQLHRCPDLSHQPAIVIAEFCRVAGGNGANRCLVQRL